MRMSRLILHRYSARAISLIFCAAQPLVATAGEPPAASAPATAAASAALPKGQSTVTVAASPGAPRGRADTDWATYNKDFLGQRFSALKQINTQNVGSLKEVCRIKLAELTSFHNGPVLIDGIMYVTTARDTVALDPRNCGVIWKSTWEPEDVMNPTTNRGVAYLDGRLFRGTNDGRVIALDVKTGTQLWKTVAADPKMGFYMSSAPIAWNGLVFMGTAGSDAGIRGRMMAYDAATGREVWRFNTIPMPGETGHDSWKSGISAETGGGGTWTSYALDVKTGELMVPVANPAPDFNVAYRPGDNLFTNSVVVLDAKTGKLKWWYQVTPNDGHDYDLGAAPVLYRDTRGNDVVALASKDGHVYVVDRKTKKLRFKTPVTTVNYAAMPTPEGVYACPGMLGGVQWNGPAFDQENRSLYVGAVDWCSEIKSGEVKYVPGQAFFAGSRTQMGKPNGWVTALDSDTGKVKWKYEAGSPVVAGVTSTAGGLVFTGDLAGNFLALESATGKPLYKMATGGAIAGGVITYSIEGKQYVATTSGNVSRSTQTFYPLSLGAPSIIILAVQ